MDVDSVEHPLHGSVGIAIQAEIEQVAEEAPALRDPEAMHALVRMLPAAQEQGGIAERQQTGADDRRAIGRIDDLIDSSWRESILDPEVASAWDRALVSLTSESPAIVWNLAGLVIFEVTDVEAGAACLAARDRVAGLAQVLNEGIEARRSLGRRSVIASPAIGAPSSPSASGASNWSRVGSSGVFHCQATEATLNPRR